VFLKIEETFRVAAPIERVWRVITDPEQVGPCIPGCQGIEVTGPTTYRVNIKVAIGPIKTTFNVDVELTEERPPSYAASTTRGEEGGKASLLTARSELSLAAVGGDATEVTYRSDISLSGRLGKYGLGIMKKKAKTYGAEFAVAFRERAEAGE
jgi:carbon monoxide dehydrogenase subunit G